MKTFKSYIAERCWPGHKPVPGKKPYSPGSCVKEDTLDEMDKSQPSSSRGAEGVPTGKKAKPEKYDKVKSDALKVLQKQYKKVKEEVEQIDESGWIGNKTKWKTTVQQTHGSDVTFRSYNHPGQPGQRSTEAFNAKGKQVGVYQHHNKMGMVQPNTNKEEVELHEDTPAWQRAEGKNPEGGLNKKGVESYRRENPGSKLQTAVTTKPSKLKPGSKAAKRRLSFCRRMKGMKEKLTSAETARDPDSRINKSLRKWNC